MKAHHLQEINDIYFINKRIKQINLNYKIFYNTLAKRYEVHDLSNPKHSLCVTTTNYPSFNLIKKLIITKRENIKTLISQIENDNSNLEQIKTNNLLDKSNEKFKEIINYSQKTTHSLTKTEIDKIVRI